MKKLFTLFVAISATTALWAAEFVVDGIVYNKLGGDSVEVESNLSKYSGDITIPSTVTYNSITYRVTQIGSYAFNNCSSLTSVIIPNSVKSVENSAFYGCKSLTSITIPNSIKSIGANAFAFCYGITSILIPNNVTSIGENAFEYINNVVYDGKAMGSPWGAKCVNGYIEGNLIYLDNSAITLCGCSHHAKGEITIPNTVKNIGAYAFFCCDSLTSIIIPDKIVEIKSSTFAYCISLTSVTIPNSVEKIYGWAFSGCTSLQSITIPNTVTIIGTDAFREVDNVIYSGTAIGAPWGAKCVNAVVEGYFLYSDSTKTTLCGCRKNATGAISIPNSVKSIGASAFSGCKYITSVTIPNSVTSVGKSAFYDCTSLPVENNIRYADTYLVGAVDRTLSSYTIKEGTKWIGDGAFSSCKNLNSIAIGDSVISIGEYAFGECSGLYNVSLGSSLKNIGSYAFAYNSMLSSVSWGDAVTSIGDNAFNSCYSIMSMTVPNSVLSIGQSAFNQVFNVNYSGQAEGSTWGAYNINRYVEGLLAYENSEKKKVVGCYGYISGSSVTLPNSVTHINANAFASRSILSITLSDSITYIGDRAFQNCSNLTTVNIPSSSLIEIGKYAFQNCSSLTSINIPSSVESVGSGAFNGCTNLPVDNNIRYADICVLEVVDKSQPSFIIKQGTKFIGDKAFKGCYNMSSIIIPNSVKSIGYSSFESCGKLKIVTIPNSTTDIAAYAFYNSNNIDTIIVTFSPFDNKEINSSINSTFPSCTKVKFLQGVETSCTSPTCATIIVDLTNFETSQYSNMSLDFEEKTYAISDGINKILVTGLHPNQGNLLRFYSQLPGSTEWRDGQSVAITPPALVLTTLAPKVTALGEAVVCATTNISEYETEVGFEWRKYNSPSDMPSKSAKAIIFNGSLQGKILNLASEYYKVRAYYKAADETMFYGDWKTFDPTEFSYFKPDVHTYFVTEPLTTNQVTLRGVVITGSEQVIKQGFEYWTVSPDAPKRNATKDVKVVYASGQMMVATIDSLAYGTTYHSRAFATTESNTVFGEEIVFTTPVDPRPIYTITLVSSLGGTISINPDGEYREGDFATVTAIAKEGYEFVEWNDGCLDNPYTFKVTENKTLEAVFINATNLFDQLIDSPSDRFTKIIRDGQLLILRNGKTYTAQGGEL